MVGLGHDLAGIHFAVQLPNTEALAVVAARIRAAGVTPEPIETGLLIHDPAKNAILLTALD